MKILHLLIMCLALALSTAKAEGEIPKDELPIFVSMLPHFTVNLGDGTFLQMEAQTLVRDDDTKMSMERYMPAVRHNVIMYLSDMFPDDLRTARQREDLRDDIASIIRTTLKEKGEKDGVKGFFITSMIMQ